MPSLSLADLVGYTGSIVGASIMLPQIIKSWKTKQVQDVSVLMLFLYLANCLLWLTYGILIVAKPVIFANSIALVMISIMVTLKTNYGKGKGGVSEH